MLEPSFKRVLFGIALLFAFTGLFGAGLYYGWIGHPSMDWREFREEFVDGRFSEVHFAGGKVTAYYADKKSQPVVLYAPANPLPEADEKWLLYMGFKHGVKVVFEPKN